jgi:hypothetical protein
MNPLIARRFISSILKNNYIIKDIEGYEFRIHKT